MVFQHLRVMGPSSKQLIFSPSDNVVFRWKLNAELHTRNGDDSITKQIFYHFILVNSEVLLFNLTINLKGSEYIGDIFRCIRERERKPILRIRRTSPQLGKRGQLIDWARDVSNKLQLNLNTFHLAIKLIDIFMDGHNIEVRSVERERLFNILTIAIVRILSCTWWLWGDCSWQPRWRRTGMSRSV